MIDFLRFVNIKSYCRISSDGGCYQHFLFSANTEFNSMVCIAFFISRNVKEFFVTFPLNDHTAIMSVALSVAENSSLTNQSNFKLKSIPTEIMFWAKL